jgi:nucleotide-binding universal stress UspA family protein
MERTRWIVVGTDFSEAADRALERAVDLAAESKARLACVHAFEDPLVAQGAIDDPTRPLLSELADAVARSNAHARGVPVELILRRGAPWDKLVNVAADLGAHLIVVGAQGQRGKGVVLGSVTTRLAANSTRCVLVVPARAGGGQEWGLHWRLGSA